MTRIRSPRELRIVMPEPPRRGDKAGDRAGASDTAGARFNQLFDTARQALRVPDKDSDAHDGEQHDGHGDDQRHRQANLDSRPDGQAAAGALARLAPALPRLPVLTSARDAARTAGGGRGAARASRGADGAGHTGQTPAVPGAPIVRQCASATEGELVADHLAERIAGFCASPAPEGAGGRWEVVVELDPAVLPRTRLHLVLSDCRLSLRFDCRDARARQLIYDYGNELRTRLEARLGARIEVTVAVN